MPGATEGDGAEVNFGDGLFELGEKPQCHDDENRGDGGDEIETLPARQADRGDAPEARGCRQAVDGAAMLDDDAAAEEADARHHAVGDARGIDIDGETSRP